jgi:hypothetical protein
MIRGRGRFCQVSKGEEGKFDCEKHPALEVIENKGKILWLGVGTISATGSSVRPEDPSSRDFSGPSLQNIVF